MSKNAYLQATDKVSRQLLSKALEGQVYDSSYATKGRKDDAAILVLKDDENVEDLIDLEDSGSNKQLLDELSGAR
ncbi:uncharacterized protein F4817DRAFT_312019 [Daldinia loculata]|uniref:uncharacterized protein n=1 Tax=Daldinia loculata TaxID=103429 RepID=UPI0020C56E27|nr:uncharacterized protein F4817DRAFT_312019 [Daldinia loculata]KAI1651190.1 hypothetical protein F4817DRAFT_312019 [Daldinia loculata]